MGFEIMTIDKRVHEFDNSNILMTDDDILIHYIRYGFDKEIDGKICRYNFLDFKEIRL